VSVSGGQQYLFARVYALTLVPPTGGEPAQFGNLAAGQSALRVAFEVNKGVKTNPNSAKITLYNLNRQARTALGAGYLVALQAGYDGLAEKIFIGTVSKVETARAGADITTTLEATDGQEALLAASFNRSYPSQTHLAQVLQDVGKAMSVDPGVVLGLPDETFPRGIALHGSCTAVLRKLCHKHGLEASVQNGKLNILPIRAHLGQAAIVLSSKTGMLGVPSATKEAVTFDALLNPKLVPGQLVQVVSANTAASGYYKIRTVKIAGDTHGDKWQANCECARLTETVQQLGPAQGFNYAQAVVPGLL
jgi:hypothetical protein